MSIFDGARDLDMADAEAEPRLLWWLAEAAKLVLVGVNAVLWPVLGWLVLAP